MRFGNAERGHVLLATSDNIAWLVAAHRDALSKFFQLYTPPASSLAQLLDKGCLMHLARACGINRPDTRVPHNEADVMQSGQELGFPLFIKPRAQVFGHDLSKGKRVTNEEELIACWRSQRRTARYDEEILAVLPDLCLPMVQSCATGTAGIYMVDGFIDRTGELYGSLACLKLLQRPRENGIGIVFQHCEIDPALEQGLRRLFLTTGFHGVFDAEFLQHGSEKLLIDVNPRFYNHMAFEIDRGLPLPWLAYLAATGNWHELAAEIRKTGDARIVRHAYIHGLATTLLLAVQGLKRILSADGHARWRQWKDDFGSLITEPVKSVDDPLPGIAEFALELSLFLQYPRSYLRELWSSPARALVPPYL
jgi:predicted ATP-grasp superfamily ATP-dependent carboligase